MTQGNDPTVHSIRGGRFVCSAGPDAPCRIYPECGCEVWSPELHSPPAPGHEPVSQDECWIDPWIDAGPLAESYGPEQTVLDDAEFPDGPVSVTFDYDHLTWEYADGTDPLAMREVTA